MEFAFLYHRNSGNPTFFYRYKTKKKQSISVLGKPKLKKQVQNYRYLSSKIHLLSAPHRFSPAAGLIPLHSK
jgi:hypothetical protein